MNVVDSSGWIEYLTGGKNARFFDAPISDSGNLIIPTICLYEVFKRVLLIYGEEKALESIASMWVGNSVELTSKIALEAAHISIEFKLAMADSIIMATAQAQDATLWTQDEHFKDIEGVKYIQK